VFFSLQVINHEIPTSVLDEMIEGKLLQENSFTLKNLRKTLGITQIQPCSVAGLQIGEIQLPSGIRLCCCCCKSLRLQL